MLSKSCKEKQNCEIFQLVFLWGSKRGSKRSSPFPLKSFDGQKGQIARGKP